ncbi:MAG: hypothetical protein ABSA27_11015 [Terriglobales bacterium]|jgi:tetratricopeptide (TPR) repeat protein
MKKYGLLAFVVFTLVMPSLVAHFAAAQDSTNAPAASTRDRLQQLTAQLQKSPDDQALREKIIALALTMNPGPATPDAATMAEGAAEYAFKNAKTNSDFSDAAKQYEKALSRASWLAADYFNCGVAHEKAGETKEAISSFDLYLMAAPNANDAQAVKKRIGGLQYAEQKAEDAANEQATAAARQIAAERQQAQVEGRFFSPLNGGIWKADNDPWGNQWAIKIVNNMLQIYLRAPKHKGVPDPNTTFDSELGYYYMLVSQPIDIREAINSRRFTAQAHSRGDDLGGVGTFAISEDSQTITEWQTFQGIPPTTTIFKRIK